MPQTIYLLYPGDNPALYRQNTIYFTSDDISAALRAIYEMDAEMRANFVGALRHELKADLRSTAMFGQKALRSKHSSLLTSSQKSVLEEIISAAQDLHNTFSTIGTIEGDISEPAIQETAQKLASGIAVCNKYYPLEETMKALGNVPVSLDEDLEWIDQSRSLAIYKWNLWFLKDYSQKEKGVYNLREDVAHFIRHQSVTGGVLSDFDSVKVDVPRLSSTVPYFRQVILPLISNAVEHAYNPAHDTDNRLSESGFKKQFVIESADDTKNNLLVLKVQDNGFGMPDDIMPYVFASGVSATKQKERGIGLSVVKEFVESHGGAIWFESERGRGTCFYFTIPYQKVQDTVYFQ